MRLANMIVEISAQPESVFAFLRDPTKVRRWQPDVLTTAVISGDGVQKGSRWRATVAEPQRGTFELEVWVADVVENERSRGLRGFWRRSSRDSLLASFGRD